MLGIILWSSAPRRRAVIWCEDQGPLAYLADDLPPDGMTAWPEAGQMVEVDAELRGDLRRVTRIRLVEGKADLAAHLPRDSRKPLLAVASEEPGADADPLPAPRAAAGAWRR